MVNASFAGGGYDQAMATALANARAKGVIVVAAAGNDGTDNDADPVYPANYAGDNLVSVAATDRSDWLASFSNYGRTTVDIAAPGVGIYSTLPNGKYGTLQRDVDGGPARRRGTGPRLGRAPDLDLQAGNRGCPEHGRPALVVDWQGGDRPPRRGEGHRLRLPRHPAPPPPAADTTGATVTAVTFGGSGTISKARVTFSEPINVRTFTAADVKLTGPAGPGGLGDRRRRGGGDEHHAV